MKESKLAFSLRKRKKNINPKYGNLCQQLKARPHKASYTMYYNNFVQICISKFYSNKANHSLKKDGLQ